MSYSHNRSSCRRDAAMRWMEAMTRMNGRWRPAPGIEPRHRGPASHGCPRTRGVRVHQRVRDLQVDVEQIHIARASVRLNPTATRCARRELQFRLVPAVRRSRGPGRSRPAESAFVVGAAAAPRPGRACGRAPRLSEVGRMPALDEFVDDAAQFLFLVHGVRGLGGPRRATRHVRRLRATRTRLRSESAPQPATVTW